MIRWVGRAPPKSSKNLYTTSQRIPGRWVLPLEPVQHPDGLVDRALTGPVWGGLLAPRTSSRYAAAARDGADDALGLAA
jgi:hypothetical protein